MYAILVILMIVCGLVAIPIIGVAVFMTVYSLPYAIWLGWNSGSKGIPKKQESDNLPAWQGMKLNFANATKLYASWVTKQPHGITKF